jgi:hypothetical protein
VFHEHACSTGGFQDLVYIILLKDRLKLVEKALITPLFLVYAVIDPCQLIV